MKQELLEYIVRACAQEVLKQIQTLNEEEETKGASAPPSDGQGTADQPSIPKEPAETSKEIPDAPPSPELKGIILINPKDKSKLQKIDIKSQDDAGLERQLHNIASKIAGGKVKTSISTIRLVKDVIKNPSSVAYLYIGKHDPNAEELFLMADKSLQVAKDSSIPVTDIASASTFSSNTFNPLQASSDEFAQQLSNKGYVVPQSIDEDLRRTIKTIAEQMFNDK